MPRISSFYGIAIHIFWRDHPPPHFHALYGEHEATIAIETLEPLEGGLPRRVLALVLEWAMMHRPIAGYCARTGSDRFGASRWRRSPVSTRRPEMLWRVVKVQALPGFKLEVEFGDGVHGVIDMSDDLWGPMFEPLRDPQRFAEVGLDEDGVVCWPGGPDLAPDAMYEELTGGRKASR